jgi:hypothetical protein
MGLENPSFEAPGVLPGEALHWTLSSVTGREELAGFGPVPVRAWEDFERWHALLAALEDASVALAFFDTVAEGYEDFEEGWANAVFLRELPPAQLVTCAFGGGTLEHYESGWSNSTYLRDWALVPSSTGVFDGEPVEDFEEQWRSNQAYAWSWAGVSATVALFDAGTQAFEDFENAWAHATTL